MRYNRENISLFYILTLHIRVVRNRYNSRFKPASQGVSTHVFILRRVIMCDTLAASSSASDDWLRLLRKFTARFTHTHTLRCVRHFGGTKVKGAVWKCVTESPVTLCWFRKRLGVSPFYTSQPPNRLCMEDCTLQIRWQRICVCVPRINCMPSFWNLNH